MNINFHDLLTLVLPGTGQVLLWSIFLYIIFFFALITLLNVPDKNMVSTLLVATTLLFAIVAKLSITAFFRPNLGRPILQPREFGMFVVNVGMFVFPLIAIGVLRARKQRAVVPAILTSLTSGLYFFLFWLIAQH